MSRVLRRLFPSPLLSLAIWAFWLLLNGSVAPGHLILGAVLGVYAPWVTRRLRPQRAYVRHPWLIIRLIGHLLLDVLQSNLLGARLFLTNPADLKSGFVTIPLRLREPHGLIVLATCINASPMLVWVRITEDRSELTLHLLELRRATELIEGLRRHYEEPLIRIFQEHHPDYRARDGAAPRGAAQAGASNDKPEAVT
ncbi:MAG: Na+/H+ antiporter subunit E [Burkholderiaceae bacterium]